MTAWRVGIGAVEGRGVDPAEPCNQLQRGLADVTEGLFTAPVPM
jgi:hypothetical protein